MEKKVKFLKFRMVCMQICGFLAVECFGIGTVAFGKGISTLSLHCGIGEYVE